MIDKLLKFSILFTILTSNINGTKSITKEVEAYVNTFVQQAKECNVRISDAELRVEMSSLGDVKKYVAICYHFTTLVIINSTFWKLLEPHEQEQTISHELGHCLLKQQHDENGLNIMNAKNFIKKSEYVEQYDYYTRRLFTKCKKPETEKFVYKEY